MACIYKKEIIPALLTQVKELDIKSRKDIFRVKNILNQLFNILIQKRKYRAKQILNIRKQLNQEAEEEIIIDVIKLLNEKVVDFIFNVLRTSK